MNNPILFSLIVFVISIGFTASVIYSLSNDSSGLKRFDNYQAVTSSSENVVWVVKSRAKQPTVYRCEYTGPSGANGCILMGGE